MTVSKEVPDLDVIVPEHGELLVEGIPAVVKRLKSKEFLSLIRVLTVGLGAGIGDIDLSGNEEEVKNKMTGLFILAIPEAVEEFGAFLFSVVDAKNPHERNDLRKAMDNPEIEVMLDVLTLVILQEKDDFASLVGKAKASLSKIQSLYQPLARPTGK
jgi:hypothetical protein